jgi:hypothetical protein
LIHSYPQFQAEYTPIFPLIGVPSAKYRSNLGG